jgi:hypothetical protein
LIEYEDDGPQMRSDFETAIEKVGISMAMPEFSYAGL